MTTSPLQTQFLQALESSKSFQLLTEDQQRALKVGFTLANDEQLQQAFAELQKTEAAIGDYETQLKAREEKRVLLAQSLKETFQEVEKEELHDNIAHDEQNSLQAADQVLASLEQPVNSAPQAQTKKPPRKKWFGIF